MKSNNPKETILNEALATYWPTPEFTPQQASQSTDRIDSPLLLKALLDGGFTNKQISPVAAIIPQLKKLSSSLDISTGLLNRLMLLDILYEQLNTQAHFDPAVMVLFYKLRPAIIRAALSDDDIFIKSSKHPLRKALDDLCSLAIGWDSGLGKNGERYFTQLEKLISPISTITLDTKTPTKAYESELNALLELLSRYEQIEQRLCQSEQAVMESKKNKHIADAAINTATENKHLPPHTIHFLHDPWRDALHRILVLHGHNSKDWFSATQTMEKLVFCMAPTDDQNQIQQKYKLVATIRSSLEKHLLNTGNDAEKSHWIDEIENQLQQILMGNKLAVEPAPQLTNIDVDGVTTSMSSAISHQVAQLKPGQWVLYKKESGETIRGKLAMIDSEAKQLLFVNLIGARRFSKSAEEFGYAMNSKKIQLLTTKNMFSTFLTKSVALFIKRHQEHQVKFAGTPTPQEAIKRQSAEKALAEAQKLQALEKQPVIIAETGASNPIAKVTAVLSSEATPGIEAEVNSLEIGSWLSMKNRVGIQMSCRIAVIYPSTGKMVIVDKSGLRVGEFFRPELVQLIMNGEVEILEKNDSFESSLARVIQTLRKDS